MLDIESSKQIDNPEASGVRFLGREVPSRSRAYRLSEKCQITVRIEPAHYHGVLEGHPTLGLRYRCGYFHWPIGSSEFAHAEVC